MTHIPVFFFSAAGFENAFHPSAAGIKIKLIYPVWRQFVSLFSWIISAKSNLPNRWACRYNLARLVGHKLPLTPWLSDDFTCRQKKCIHSFSVVTINLLTRPSGVTLYPNMKWLDRCSSSILKLFGAGLRMFPAGKLSASVRAGRSESCHMEWHILDQLHASELKGAHV